jgi:hypothetical protein
MIVMAGANLMIGFEADARYLQTVLLEKIHPLLHMAQKGM